MKVAFHVDQLWFDAPGGIGTYVEELLWRHLARTPDVEIVPFYSRWRGRSPREAPLTTDGRFPGVELPFSTRTLYPAWAYLRRPHLPSALAEADIVHATNHSAVPPIRPRQQLVVTVHDLVFERFPALVPRRWRALYRRGLRVAIREAGALLVPSDAVRGELVAGGADPEKVHVTPLGSSVDPDSIHGEMPDIPEDDLESWGIVPPYILSVGTLEPRKNHLRLLGAYRRLAQGGLPHALVLIGDRGWGDADLIEALEGPGPGRVIRASGLSGRTLAAAYAAADAVAYVSLYEGFGLPVLEAMSMGTPVVTSNVSSMPEVAGDAALLVDPTDEEAIASALRRVLTEPGLVEELRAEGRERARAFSWERTAEATLEVYRSLVGQAS